MGQLKDLLERPLSELSDSELEQRIYQLRRLKVSTRKPKVTETAEEKRLKSLIKQLSPEQLNTLFSYLKEKNDE